MMKKPRFEFNCYWYKNRHLFPPSPNYIETDFQIAKHMIDYRITLLKHISGIEAGLFNSLLSTWWPDKSFCFRLEILGLELVISNRLPPPED